MGTLPTEEIPQGCLYLSRLVYNQFEEVKNQRKYDTDHFLEQLISLYCRQGGEKKGLDVRLDLAIKFLSLLSLTPFENSNDLMTHLLAIHSSHEKSQERTQSNTSETAERTDQPKPKKNKRKPDFVQKKPYTTPAVTPSTKNASLNSVIDNLASRSRSPSVSFSEDSGCFDTSKEEPKLVSNGSGQDAMSHETEGLDLSVVKKEEVGMGAKRQKVDKDQPFFLPQGSTPFSQLKQVLSASAPRTFPPAWRSNSVPVGDSNALISPKQPLSLQTSPQNYILNNVAQISDLGHKKDGIFDQEVSPIVVDGDNNSKMEDDDSESEKYNYVLTGLDSPESPEDADDDSPISMKMPVKFPFPATKKHSNTSDLSLTVPLKIVEEEPQDLTSPQKSNKPKIITIGQSDGMPQLQAPGVNQPVFPNMPPLAPAMIPGVFRHPKSGQLIGEPQLAMQNMGQQPRIITLPVNQGTRPYLLPKNAQQNMVGVSPVLSPPGPPPKLIPASSINSGIQYQANMGASTPNGSIGNSPVLSLDPNSNQNFSKTKTTAVANGAIMVQFDLDKNFGENQQLEDEAMRFRRKRKKMEDTSSFRDPPEASLPFNGPNKYRFYCDVCDTGFTRRYTFNRHRCKGKVEKHYCQLCDKAYLSKYKLKDHILVKHEGQTVACPDCGKRFSSRSSMEMHKKQQHEGQFSIFCKVCGKGFNHTGHYYGHMNKHTNTKPFWCQKCGKRFYGSSYLHNHKQVCRGDEDWNHQCTVCQRKFKCELYLKKHMKVHDPTPLFQQSLDSSENEVALATDGDTSMSNPGDDSVDAIAGAPDDMPTDLTGPSKVCGLNNNEFQQIDQAVA